jgi:hypothetical protein
MTASRCPGCGHRIEATHGAECPVGDYGTAVTAEQAEQPQQELGLG